MSAQALWLEVLALAVEDALAGTDPAARYYVTHPHRDFVTICNLAGLDPEAVRDRATRLIAEHEANPPSPDAPNAQLYQHNGRNLTLTQWAAETGISKIALYCRIRKGWTLERALATPARPTRKAKPKAQILAEMTAFEPELITDEEAAELSHQQKGRPEEHPSQFTALTCRATPVSAGFDPCMADDSFAGSPCVNLTIQPPVTLSDFAPFVGTGRGSRPHKQKERSEERPSILLPEGPPCPRPITAGLGSPPLAQVRPAVSPHVSQAGQHPGVGSDFVPIEGTGGGTASQETPEIPFTTEATP